MEKIEVHDTGKLVDSLSQRFQAMYEANQADPWIFCPICKTEMGKRSENRQTCRMCELRNAEREREIAKALTKIPRRYRAATMTDALRLRLVNCLPDGPGPHVLTLAGPPNVGKTWNACALWRHCVEQGIAVKFWLVSDLMIFLASLWRQEKELPYDRIKELEQFSGLLILDDLGKEKLTESAGQNLFAILNNRVMFDRPTVITTNLPWTTKGDVESVESVYGKAWLWRLQPGYVLMTERSRHA